MDSLLYKDITINEAVQYFKNGIVKYVNAVNNHVNILLLANEFDALVSICYNIGQNGFNHSTFLKEINACYNPDDIFKAILMWNKPKMIIDRRTKEANLYVNGTFTSNGTVLYEDTDGKGHQLASTRKLIDVSSYF